MKPRALITGITGQDGSYLAEYLLGLGYEVHGLVRRVALENPDERLGRIQHIVDKVELHSGNLESYPSIYRLFSKVAFDECYHLAAQSFVAESFADSLSTMNTNVAGTHYVLAALQELRPKCKLYFAGSSEMYGEVHATPQNEQTPFLPLSPYGISKLTGFHLTRNYRDSYGLFCCSGILFNHESPRRGFEFVSRKITSTVARIKHGLVDKLRLGNLEAKRDWGYAEEYVQAMHRMLQQPKPVDYVIATGQSHSVREFCEVAFAQVGLDYRDYVEVDPKFLRPVDIELLMGDASKAKAELGWEAQTKFAKLASMMVAADMELAEQQARQKLSEGVLE